MSAQIAGGGGRSGYPVGPSCRVSDAVVADGRDQRGAELTKSFSKGLSFGTLFTLNDENLWRLVFCYQDLLY